MLNSYCKTISLGVHTIQNLNPNGPWAIPNIEIRTTDLDPEGQAKPKPGNKNKIQSVAIYFLI
jgi:hypothetical protein